jgi:uncharacterized membrane protein
MEDLLKAGTLQVVLVVEAAAVLVILLGILEALWRLVRRLVRERDLPDADKESIRLHLARWLSLALELALAADVLRTVIAPSWDEIGRLAAIAALRTALNLVLRQEIEHSERRRGDPG